MKLPATRLLGLGLCLGLLSAAAYSQGPLPVTGLPAEDPVAAAVIAEGDGNSQVMRHLEVLTKSIGPRLTSSSNLTLACRWAAQQFESWGLENVRLEEWGTFPVGFDRGPWSGWMVEPRLQPLAFGTNAWTAGTGGLPVRGRLAAAPKSAEELEAARGTLRGCWVLIGATNPRYDDDGEEFRSQLGRFLDAEGILGTIRASSSEQLIHTGGSSRVSYDALPKRVQINLRRDQAKELGALLEAQQTGDGKEIILEFSVDNRFLPGPVPLYNVLAEIPGAEKPEEFVIMGGHIDSWDGASGAQDNGTGTSTTLEAARLLAKALQDTGLRPRRTIRFTLWSGEEQGLLGSRAYIEQHPDETARISAVIVHDGGTNYLSGISATPLLKPIFDEVFDPVVKMVAGYEDKEFEFAVRAVDALPRGVGSDHDAYLSAGVPGFFWGQTGKTSYGYIHHTQHDHYDQAVEKYQQHSAKVIAIAAWRVANLPDLLPRTDLGSPRPRRSLGVTMDENDALRVTAVTEDGLAAKAGLRAGDRVVQIDEQKIETSGDLRRALRGGGEQKVVIIQRGEEKLAFRFDWENQKVELLPAVPAAPPAEPAAPTGN